MPIDSIFPDGSASVNQTVRYLLGSLPTEQRDAQMRFKKLARCMASPRVERAGGR